MKMTNIKLLKIEPFKIFENKQNGETFYAKKMFKLVFALYKLRKGIEPVEVAKLLLKAAE